MWVASFTLASGLAQTLHHLGLALSSAPSDYTCRLWPFFLDPQEGVESCDSCVLPGAPAEGFQPALREVAYQPLGGAEALAADTSSVQGGRMTRGRTW